MQPGFQPVAVLLSYIWAGEEHPDVQPAELQVPETLSLKLPQYHVLQPVVTDVGTRYMVIVAGADEHAVKPVLVT